MLANTSGLAMIESNMEISRENIRPARPEDAPHAAPLIIETGYQSNRIAFGSLDNARKVLTNMFARPRNVHSYNFATVYELNDKVAGILIGYTREQERKSFWPSAFFLSSRLGFRMGGILRIQGMIGKIEPGDYYVHVLAVVPEFRSHGIGAMLMKEAERIAVENGKSRISLLVEAQNEGAIKFYQREGYEVIGPRQDKVLLKRHSFHGYVKMVKDISRSFFG